MKWDKRFLSLADEISKWSKDPSLGVGAVIVRPDKTIASIGFNGFPKYIDDTGLENREYKYKRIIHAEMNAILHSKESLKGYTIYSNVFPCSECMKHIVQTGITNVVSGNTRFMCEYFHHDISLDIVKKSNIECSIYMEK